MIPKIIHYCWFGRNKKPELIEKCIESWHKFCPDYQIIEWNEDNFNINSCIYSQQAYETKQWAYVSDYARLCALYEYGGIYLDTDMELLKPIDDLLDNQGVLSFEAKDYVCLGFIGAEINHPFIKELKEEYEHLDSCDCNRSLENMTNVRRMRKTLLAGGLKNNGKQQTVCGMTIYPQRLFFPYNLGLLFDSKPRNSYSVHYATGLWGNGNKLSKGKKRYLKLVVVNKIRNLIGTDTVDKIKMKVSKGT